MIAASAALAAALALPAVGESSAPPNAPARPSKPSASTEHVDVFAGYSYFHSGSAGLHGFEASASYPVTREIRIVADLALQFGSFAGADLSESEVLLGARHDWTLDRFRPFAEVLVGLAHHSESFASPGGSLESGGTHFAFGPGLGTDYRLSESWRARLDFTLLLVNAGGFEASPRVSAGIVYVFAR